MDETLDNIPTMTYDNIPNLEVVFTFYASKMCTFVRKIHALFLYLVELV